jgi:hypothetical protein
MSRSTRLAARSLSVSVPDTSADPLCAADAIARFC